MISHKIYDLKLLRPLVSMGSTLAMCIILSACQTSKAESNNSGAHIQSAHLNSNQHNREYSLNKPNIRIIGNNEDRLYIVNGKKFSNIQLSEKQKSELAALSSKLEHLEDSIEFDQERMEVWSEKMEAVAEQMEEEAEKLEEIFEGLEVDDIDIDFEDGKFSKFEDLSKNMSVFSEKMKLASKTFAVKMKHLEKKIEAMEIDMPKIDNNVLKQIEIEAQKMESLLIEIAQDI